MASEMGLSHATTNQFETIHYRSKLTAKKTLFFHEFWIGLAVNSVLKKDLILRKHSANSDDPA